MRRTAALLAAGAIGLAGSAGASPGPSTFAEAKGLAEEAGKPILIDFFTEW